MEEPSTKRRRTRKKEAASSATGLGSQSEPRQMFNGRVPVGTIAGSPINAEVTILSQPPYLTRFEFTFLDRLNTFQIEGISGQGMSGFMQKSVSRYPQFGTVDELGNVNSTMEQKKEAILQLVRDIVVAIDAIYKRYARSLLDYAVWFREHRAGAATYADLVTLKACHLIVHCNFIAPNVSWDVVGFPGTA